MMYKHLNPFAMLDEANVVNKKTTKAFKSDFHSEQHETHTKLADSHKRAYSDLEKHLGKHQSIMDKASVGVIHKMIKSHMAMEKAHRKTAAGHFNQAVKLIRQSNEKVYGKGPYLPR